MYNEEFIQTGDSCAAATLMIAAYEFGLIEDVSAVRETELYTITASRELSERLGRDTDDPESWVSIPSNIKQAADTLNLNATVCVFDDLDLAKHNLSELQELKEQYIDTCDTTSVSVQEIPNLLASRSLQLLVYLDGRPLEQHWLLLHTDETGEYYIYDTAYGSNQPAKLNETLQFNSKTITPENGEEYRSNNFLGIGILLEPK